MTRKKIYVTAKDIAGGVPQSAEFCPLAFAIKRGLETAKALILSTEWWAEWANISVMMARQWRKLPRSGCRFVKAFDDRKHVAPFNFFIEVPDAS